MFVIPVIMGLLSPQIKQVVPYLKERETIYIYVDVRSRDEFVVRRSNLIISETKPRIGFHWPLHKWPSIWLLKERLFIYSQYKIEVRDAYDYDVYGEVPCMKWSKNGFLHKFPQGTFAADGLFTISLYECIYWLDYEDDIKRFMNTYRLEVRLEDFLEYITSGRLDKDKEKYNAMRDNGVPIDAHESFGDYDPLWWRIVGIQFAMPKYPKVHRTSFPRRDSPN